MPYSYDFATSLQPMDLERHYWLNGACLSCGFGARLPSRIADLLDIAMAVYAADRRSPRDFKGPNTGQRQIQVRLAVREPALWASRDVLTRLGDTLVWLSDDLWTFEFVQRKGEPSPAESARFLFPSPTERPATGSLFSESLDSLAGLATQTRAQSNPSLVLVSGYSSDRLGHQQSEQAKGIRSAWRDEGLHGGKAPEIRHIAVPFGINKLKRLREEKSQRTRALVFLTLGVTAAMQAGVDRL